MESTRPSASHTHQAFRRSATFEEWVVNDTYSNLNLVYNAESEPADIQDNFKTPIDPTGLPIDCVSRIFHFACEPISLDGRWSRAFYPLWLGHVSRAWRDVAWATSEIWQTIVLQMRPDTYEVQSELLQEWVERARSRPLDIYLSMRREAGSMSLLDYITYLQQTRDWEPPTRIFQKLRQHSNQWRYVSFRIPDRWGKAFCHPEGNDNGEGANTRVESLALPLLNSVSIQSSSPLYQNTITTDMDFSKAPTLRRIAIHHYKLIPGFFDEVFPTAQITDLVLVRIIDVDLLNLLNSFPRLEQAELINIKYLFRPLKIASSDHLRTLKVVFSSEADFNRFFGYVAFPNLTKLVIYLPIFSRYLSFFRQFIEHSGCYLTSLSLECGQIINEHDLIDLLSSLPSLTNLNIRNNLKHIRGRELPDPLGACIGEAFFAVLHTDGNNVYLPNLEVFSYEGILAVQDFNFIEPLIVRSLRSRPDIEVNTDLASVAVLQRAIIKVDQGSTEAKIITGEYADPRALAMIEKGILTLVNLDGSHWR